MFKLCDKIKDTFTNIQMCVWDTENNYVCFKNEHQLLIINQQGDTIYRLV